jgi:hypothetical protein
MYIQLKNQKEAANLQQNTLRVYGAIDLGKSKKWEEWLSVDL